MDIIFWNESSSPSHFVTSLSPRSRSPSIITSPYFLLPAPSCNHNLILCNQFRMKTPPALDMLTQTASKQRSQRHKSSTTIRPNPSSRLTIYCTEMIFVAPKPLQLSTHASDRKKRGRVKAGKCAAGHLIAKNNWSRLSYKCNPFYMVMVNKHGIRINTHICWHQRVCSCMCVCLPSLISWWLSLVIVPTAKSPGQCTTNALVSLAVRGICRVWVHVFVWLCLVAPGKVAKPKTCYIQTESRCVWCSLRTDAGFASKHFPQSVLLQQQEKSLFIAAQSLNVWHVFFCCNNRSSIHRVVWEKNFKLRIWMSRNNNEVIMQTYTYWSYKQAVLRGQ